MQFVRFGHLGKIGIGIRYIRNIFSLIISKTGNGTVSPDVGVHTYAEGTVLDITTTETDEDYYFEKFVEDGVDKLDNPLTVIMNEAKRVEAVFLAWQTIMDVFSNAPVYDSVNANWKFEGGDFDAVVNKQQCVTSNGTSNYIDTGIKPATNTVKVIKGKFNEKSDTKAFGASSGNGRFYIRCGLTNFLFGYGNSIRDSGLSDTNPHAFIFYGNKLWILPINTDTSDTGLLNIINNITPACTSPGTLVPDVNIYMFTAAISLYCNFTLLEYELGTMTAGVFSWAKKYKGNHRAGTSLYEEVSGTWTAISGGVEADLWANTMDGVEPLELTQGFTAYKNNSDATKYLNVLGNNNLTISNYTKEGYYMPGSGMIKALKNTIIIPEDAILNLGIASGEYTWAQLNALENSVRLQITKSSNQISNLIVKKKNS